jgi:hypothetical protein
MELQLDEPMIVARTTDAVLLVGRANLGQDNPPSQLWRAGSGYGRKQPLQVWFKFVDGLTDVQPPEAWTVPAP